MGRVFFVFPHGDAISCPQTLGRNVAKRLSRHFDVVQLDWSDTRELEPQPGDVLLGHPHPFSRTTFRRNMKKPGWSRVIMMTPYTHDTRQVAFCDAIVPVCDLYLAITGRYWFDSLSTSPFSHWAPKMRRLDLAVDRHDFPVVKNAFNAAGERRFVYIGHDGWQKNPRYLEQIAKLLPAKKLSWIGSGTRLEGLISLGRLDFATDAARSVVAQHDFLVTVGRFDANPTTILEAMAWGLIPVCTPTSGYVGYEGIVNVPLDDPSRAADVLVSLDEIGTGKLERMREANWRLLDAHFNWDRFADDVLGAIRSDSRPSMGREPLRRRALLRAHALTAPTQRTNLRLHAKRMAPDWLLRLRSRWH
jgi:glycosyltransferase involved in cell wall biosynthesis